ncbi:MAG: avidin/streptavidin family protein [Actinomycetota bacterium]|nr:avidin/streptavidin family protein [Actinomycetota bacterium]
MTNPKGAHLMTWIGEWHSQYGSTLTITDAADQRIQGSFRTALGDAGFR